MINRIGLYLKMNNTMNCSCEEIIDENSADYIITQVFGWLTGILTLIKIMFLYLMMN